MPTFHAESIQQCWRERKWLNIAWLAAHETTASTIILMLLRIKQSPHTLDALRSEQKQVCLLILSSVSRLEWSHLSWANSMRMLPLPLALV